MNYLSDLDLAFIYDSPEEAQDPIPGRIVQLIQRVMRMLSTPLQEGPGYKADVRLRTTGNYGPLVVTKNSWLDYYSRQTDLCEIQPLLSLRAVAGNRELGRWIEKKAREFCCFKSDSESVRSILSELRRCTEQEQSEGRSEFIDLDLSPWGLADLELLNRSCQRTLGGDDAGLQKPSEATSSEIVFSRVLESEEQRRSLMNDFFVFRRIEHILQLFANDRSGRLTKEQLDSLILLGLFPAGQQGVGVEKWEDLLHFRRRITEAWENLCNELLKQPF
jgi:glutamate-ammonia-ligase adenylyltransferase